MGGYGDAGGTANTGKLLDGDDVFEKLEPRTAIFLRHDHSQIPLFPHRFKKFLRIDAGFVHLGCVRPDDPLGKIPDTGAKVVIFFF